MSSVELAIHESLFGPAGDPLEYPSERPTEPCFVHGTTAHRLSWSWDLPAVRLEDGRLLEDVLSTIGGTPLSDRVVQVAFGANRNLENIAWKLDNYRLDPDAGVSTDVIALPGSIEDADVVACNIGYWGYVYAGLALHRPPLLLRPYLAGSRVPVTVLLLDEAQMHAFHISEGVPRNEYEARQHVSCDVGVVDVHVLGRTLEAQVYGLPLPFLSLDGGHLPVGFAAVATDGPPDRVPRLDQHGLWTAIVDRLRDDLMPWVGAADSADVVELIRAGAAARMSGRRGSGDLGQRVYELIRQRIIEALPLIDADGEPATGTKHLPGAMSVEDAWRPHPRLGPSVRQGPGAIS